MRGSYVLTEEGSRAWESPRSGLPAHYRQILGLIRSKTSADEIHLGMPGHSRRQLDYWLDELDTLGFITLLPVGSEAEPGPAENRQDNILRRGSERNRHHARR